MLSHLKLDNSYSNATLKLRIMTYRLFIIVILMILCFINSCIEKGVNSEHLEKEKILILLEQQRKFHFDKMAEELVSQLSIKYIDINGGEITRPSKEENILNFRNYFESIEFEKWDDIIPPIIRFSEDNKMAYVIINKEVVFTYNDENEHILSHNTEYSWVAIYTKYKGAWKIDCIASTNKPSNIKEVKE